MFLLTCPTCGLDHLVGPRSIRRLYNVRPGVIVVELCCPQGHRVLEVTGNTGNTGNTGRTYAAAAAIPRAG